MSATRTAIRAFGALLLLISSSRLHAQTQFAATTAPATVTVQQPAGANLHVTCDSGCAAGVGTQDVNLKNYTGAAVGAGNAAFVQPGTAATWDVSDRAARLVGHVTVDSGSLTITNSAFAATQSGTWSTRTQDGSGNAITSTASALDINIKSGSIANSGFNVNNFPAGFANSDTIVAPLPAGTNTIGAVFGTGAPGLASPGVMSVQGVKNGVVLPISGAVSVSNLPAVQPVSGAVTVAAPVQVYATQMIPMSLPPGPPPLPAAANNNPLLYRSAMRVYCQQNLLGCDPGLGR